MVEPSTLKQAKDIIAYLKKQNEKDSFATKLSDRFQKNRTNTNSQHTASCISLQSCENIQNKTKVLLNEYVPKTIPFTNCTQDKNTANKNEEIKDIISFLKAKKEQNLVDETITNHDNLRNDPDTTNFTNSYMKNEDINVLINSGAIVKKHNPNYLQKKNNKRFKISHNNDKKQPGLKQFYHIVKSARSCQSNSLEFCEFNSKPFALHSTSITSKSKDRNFSNNFKESEKSLRVMPVEKANKLFSFQSSPKSNETKLWDIFCKIKRSNETVRKQPQQFNKDNKSTITLDDFCNNVVTISNDKLEKENANSKASEDMGNIFLKSFSTGNITSEKEKYKDTNSVPLTNSEIKNVKEKLENSTKTFDEVIERILKKINNGGNSSPKDELEQSINEERIIQYNDCNRKSDIINSQWHTIDFSADNNENVSLSAKYSIPEYNRDSDLHKYLMKDVDNKKSEVINKVNDSNFSGILGKHHMTGVESLIKEQKSCGDRIDSFNKEKISLKSFNNGKIIMKKENYKNIDSVTNLGEINNAENKLEKSIKEKVIVRTLIQRSGSNKNSQTLQCKEKSRNLNILVTESLVKNNKGNNLSSETNLVEYHEDCDLQKYSIRDYFNNFSQDSEIYYSQFTQKCAGSEKNENLNQINELDLVLEKEHDSKEVKVDFVNQKEQSIKEFYKCEDTNCSQNKTNVENSLETQIDLLEDERKKSILMATYKRQMENTKENEGNSKINKPFKLEDFLKNLVSSTEKKECEKNVSCKNKSYVKRYRKGKTKIYKLKKLKKKCLEGDTEDMNEDVSLQDLLKKLSSDNCGTISRMSRFRSGSSISTSSSYITDDSKSEILSTGSKELTLPQQRLRHGFNELSKDKSLCYARKELDEVPEHDKEDIKIKIQDIFFQILDDFKNKRTSFFKHRKQSFDNCIFKDGR